MSTQIDIYRQMSALSAEMVAAARDQEWERLVELESRVSALRDTLIANGDNTALAPHELNAKADLIRQILEDDAEVRRHTEPWMEHVRQFLGHSASQRRVNDLYGGGAPSLLGGALR